MTNGCPSDRLAPLEPDHHVAGIDWAKDDHAVAVVDAAGRTVGRFTVPHTVAGLRELVPQRPTNVRVSCVIDRGQLWPGPSRCPVSGSAYGDHPTRPDAVSTTSAYIG